MEPAEAALVPAVEYVARAFNDLGLTPPQDPTVQYFYDRPFRVLNCGRFVEACMASTPLSRLGLRGSIDQFVDSTDVLSSADPIERRRMFNTVGNARNRIPARRR